VYLIATRVIPYQGVNEAAGLEVERIILKFARSHPHLRPGDSCTGVSGPSPAPMTPEAYPGCEWADEPKPAKPRRHDLRPNENR
jgi:hypothetical protein